MIYLHSNQPGQILKLARACVFITAAEMVGALRGLGDELSEDEYLRYEDNALAAETMPAFRWFLACRVLCLPSDVIVEGYSEKIQIAAVQFSIKEGTFVFPVTPYLMNKLANTQGDAPNTALSR